MMHLVFLKVTNIYLNGGRVVARQIKTQEVARFITFTLEILILRNFAFMLLFTIFIEMYLLIYLGELHLSVVAVEAFYFTLL